MKRAFRIAALALSLALLAGVFTGCTSSELYRIILPAEAAESGETTTEVTSRSDGQTASNSDAQPAATPASATGTIEVTPEAVQESMNAVYEALSRGMESDAVAQLQTKLEELGYMDEVTGFYGGGTEQAVAEFQDSHGIEADGIAGPETQALMDSSLKTAPSATSELESRAATAPASEEPAPTASPETAYSELSRGMENEAVSALQAKLVQLGYMDSPTGYYGGNTEQAIAEFQTNHGLSSSGIATAETQAKVDEVLHGSPAASAQN